MSTPSQDCAPLVDALIQAVKAECDEFHERCNNSYSTEALGLCKERVALCKQALLSAVSCDYLVEALECLLPGLVLDLRYADDDGDKDAMRNRIRTVTDALAKAYAPRQGSERNS